MTQRRLVVAATLVALTLTACGSGEQKEPSLEDQVQVTGDFAAKPAVRIKAPLEVTKSASWVAQAGDGDQVGAEATVILQLTLANARTGKVAVSTLNEGQRPLDIKLGGDEVFTSLSQALVGKTANSRVVVASTSDDTYGDSGAPQLGIKGGDPVVMVADVLSTDPTSVLDGPTGASKDAPATAPTLVEQDDPSAGFDVTGLRKPKKLVVIPLREGTGPTVETPSRVAVDYVIQVWGAPQPVQESYSKEPILASIGTATGVIKAWDRALVGQKEGARLMIITPPSLAYGASPQADIPANSTLVFLVDVLGVG